MVITGRIPQMCKLWYTPLKPMMGGILHVFVVDTSIARETRHKKYKWFGFYLTLALHLHQTGRVSD